jgi:hypothetical protein
MVTAKVELLTEKKDARTFKTKVLATKKSDNSKKYRENFCRACSHWGKKR